MCVWACAVWRIVARESLAEDRHSPAQGRMEAVQQAGACWPTGGGEGCGHWPVVRWGEAQRETRWPTTQGLHLP